MGREIRKEKDWLGNEKEVIYEDNSKVGETRHETNVWGTRVDRTYDNDGNRVSETRHETKFTGTPVDRTYDNEGQRISETRHERTFTGTPVDRTYDNEDSRISETRREKTFWGKNIKRVYQETDGKSPAGYRGGQSAASSPSSSSAGSPSAGNYGKLAIGGLVCFAMVYLVAYALSGSGGSRTRFGPAESTVTLDSARMAIPELINRLYVTLNQGNLSASRAILSPQLSGNAQKLDYICRPFAYRAHYIEGIIERSDHQFQANVHVLFQPMEERVYVLVFGSSGGRLILFDVMDADENWFGPGKRTAIELGRKFAYAAKARREDILAQVVAPSLDLSKLSSDEEYRWRLQEMGELRDAQVDVQLYYGMKFHVSVESARTKGFCTDTWDFLVDRIRGEYKIVTWGFTPIVGCYSLFKRYSATEDPNLGSYTLGRFGLAGSPTAQSRGRQKPQVTMKMSSDL